MRSGDNLRQFQRYGECDPLGEKLEISLFVRQQRKECTHCRYDTA